VKIDNLIIIKGGAYSDIKKALRQWIDLYSKDLQDGLNFQFSKNRSGNHIIQADKRLDNERFYYLINYLKYPENIEYKIDIEGFTTGKDKNKLKGRELLVYISPTDKEFDNVFVTTSENENFKIDFSGRITEGRERKTYLYPNNLNLGQSETIKVQNKQDLNRKIESPKDKLNKRFKILASIVISAFALTFLLFRTEVNFLTINYTMAFAVMGWFTFDYKILQVDKLYFSSMGLGLVILTYGYLLNNEFSNEDNSPLILIGTTMPIFFLTLQRPFRFVFKKIMKREPKVEKPAPSFADFVYIFILWLTTILIPTFYYTR
jgi:hypothetical protein